MTIYYSLGEVSKLLGVKPHRIVYSHTVGIVPEPERVFGNRAYQWADLVVLAEHFGVDLNAEGKGQEDDSTGN